MSCIHFIQVLNRLQLTAELQK